MGVCFRLKAAAREHIEERLLSPQTVAQRNPQVLISTLPNQC